jgi:hypothetical protein
MNRDLYAEVSAQIFTELEAGAAPWVKPRSASPGANTQCNAFSRKICLSCKPDEPCGGPINSDRLSKRVDCLRNERSLPVSHQKGPRQNATNALEIERKRRKINRPELCPAAHNGLVAGSTPGPTSEKSFGGSTSLWTAASETPVSAKSGRGSLK